MHKTHSIEIGGRKKVNMDKKTKSRMLAEESAKTLKAREKLRKEIETNRDQFTPQALEKKVSEIQHWISRHAHQRVVLRDKTISLFDENQNTAKISQKIVHLAEKLSVEIENVSTEKKSAKQ